MRTVLHKVNKGSDKNKSYSWYYDEELSCTSFMKTFTDLEILKRINLVV